MTREWAEPDACGPNKMSRCRQASIVTPDGLTTLAARWALAHIRHKQRSPPWREPGGQEGQCGLLLVDEWYVRSPPSGLKDSTV